MLQTPTMTLTLTMITLKADTDDESNSNGSDESESETDDSTSSTESSDDDSTGDNGDAANIIDDDIEQNPPSDQNGANQGAHDGNDEDQIAHDGDVEDQGAEEESMGPQDDRNDESNLHQEAHDDSTPKKATKKGSYAEVLKTKLVTMRRNTGYNLRQIEKKSKSLKRRFDRLHFQLLQYHSKALVTKRTGKQIAAYVQSQILLTQMSTKKGVAKHGEKAIMAIIKEFTQLDEKDVFDPIKRDQLTKEQLAKAMRTITAIKEK